MKCRAVSTLAFLFLVAVFLLAVGHSPANAVDKPCPWRIVKVKVGKWGNGNTKAGIWVQGSFPANLGPERPEWSVNGVNVGKASKQPGHLFIPNSSQYLKPGENTITVRFSWPPYAGASDSRTITGFDWDQVPNGGYRLY